MERLHRGGFHVVTAYAYYRCSFVATCPHDHDPVQNIFENVDELCDTCPHDHDPVQNIFENGDEDSVDWIAIASGGHGTNIFIFVEKNFSRRNTPPDAVLDRLPWRARR